MCHVCLSYLKNWSEFIRFANKTNRTRLRPFDSGWSSSRPYCLENRSKTRPFLANPLWVFLTEMPATLRRIFQQNNEFFYVVCIPLFVQETNINLPSIIFKILTDENLITTRYYREHQPVSLNSLKLQSFRWNFATFWKHIPKVIASWTFVFLVIREICQL